MPGARSRTHGANSWSQWSGEKHPGGQGTGRVQRGVVDRKRRQHAQRQGQADRDAGEGRAAHRVGDAVQTQLALDRHKPAAVADKAIGTQPRHGKLRDIEELCRAQHAVERAVAGVDRGQVDGHVDHGDPVEVV